MTSLSFDDDESVRATHRGLRRSSGSFDVQLMRCGFLPSNSVSSFDVRDLQDMELNEVEESEENGSQDNSSCPGDQSPKPMNTMSITAAFDERKRAAVRRLRRTFSEQEELLNKSHHGGTVSVGSRNFVPAPLRRTISASMPRRKHLAKKNAMAA